MEKLVERRAHHEEVYRNLERKGDPAISSFDTDVKHVFFLLVGRSDLK